MQRVMIGTSLGPYKIIGTLGVGGMGEVYLAEDTRLGRKVAVKVLPAEFAADPERLARFEQEARAAAALNHPHIAAVFDVGKELVGADGGDSVVHYMVQEYLEGQTLGERLNSKGAMPTGKGLRLAVEIAEALAAAHGAGIVHRDLKPGNIFVSPDGHAKVLDFGLAKLTEVAAPNANSDSRSPTMLGTVAGQVMGTAGYMAPEQVEGETVDGRADVFAFGCVLYEIVTGRRAFAGKNVLDTLHKIANSEPQPIAEVSDQLPVDLQRVLRKCLAKEPAARYQTAGDLAVDLRALSSDVEAGTALPLSAASATMPHLAGAAGAGAAAKGGRRGGSLIPTLAAGIAGIVIGAVALWFWLGSPPAEVTRFEIVLPEGWVLGRGVEVSPDGREIVFSASDTERRTGIFRRTFDDLAPQFINGSDGGELPHFSPDGEWIAFGTADRLMKIPAAGGEPLELARYSGAIFSTWMSDDAIAFENSGAIYRVSSAGGPVETLADEGGEPRYDHPFAPPGGEHLLISVRENSQWSVAALDLATGQPRHLVDNASGPGYLPAGFLTFAREGALWAQALDLATMELSGTPFPLRSDVRTTSQYANLSVSPNGVMAYVPGTGVTDGERLVWLDSAGGFSDAGSPAPGSIYVPRLSPDEQSVAMQVEADGTFVYTYDFRRDTFSLLRMPGEELGGRPVWSPDGEWIYYTANIDGELDIHRARADRSAPAERFLQRPAWQRSLAFSPDGAHLLFEDSESGAAASDIYFIAIDGGEPEPLRATDADEDQASFSPDGRWVAFRSDASGRSEVYATPFPGPGRTIQVSNDGGSSPAWAKDGSRVYYSVSPGALMEAVVVPGPDLDFEAPRRVVADGIPAPTRGASFDTARDGRLIMSNADAGDLSSPERSALVVVLEWFEIVEERAPRR